METKQRETMDWNLIDEVLGLDAVRTMYMFGPPGIGKTYSAYHTGRIDNGVYAVTLTEDTPAAELRGHYVPKGGEMVWHDGPFVEAMRKGARLVVNEVSHGPAECLSLLYPVLESADTARLTLPTNETVTPAEGFHVICTDNCPPIGLPAALQDRFDSTIEINKPHPNALARLDDDLRQAAEKTINNQEDRTVGLRGWFSIQKLRGDVGLKRACHIVLGEARGRQLYESIKLGS